MGRKELIPKLVEFAQEIWEVKEDWPHGDLHAAQTMDYALVLAEKLGMEPKEKERLEEVASLHDTGYKLVQEGIIKAEGHHYGSYLIARLSLDRLAATNIFLHVADVLPEDTPLSARVLRDADRLAGMGWTGIIREAYYLGFRHVYFTIAPEEVENFLLYDFRLPPLPEDYEASPRYFCLNHVGPYLVKNGLQEKMLEGCDRLLERFYGKRGESGEWLMEPVMPIAQELFKPKADALVEFMGWLTNR